MHKNTANPSFKDKFAVSYFPLFAPHTLKIIIPHSTACTGEMGSFKIKMPASTDTTVIIFENDDARTASIFDVA